MFHGRPASPPQMSVVGFDFGSETCVVAVARRRGIDVIQNDVGKRKTETVVSLVGNQRLMGTEAHAKAMSNYKNTFIYTKRFLGRSSDDPMLPTEKSFVPLKTVDLNGS